MKRTLIVAAVLALVVLAAVLMLTRPDAGDRFWTEFHALYPGIPASAEAGLFQTRRALPGTRHPRERRGRARGQGRAALRGRRTAGVVGGVAALPGERRLLEPRDRARVPRALGASRLCHTVTERSNEAPRPTPNVDRGKSNHPQRGSST